MTSTAGRRPAPLRALVAAAAVATLAGVAPRATAQIPQHAQATLYARADGDDVKVALQIRIDPGWHIYQGPTVQEMGAPDAVGTPTSIELLGEGFEWSAPRFPTPTREDQDFGSFKTWILEHVGSPVIWFRGRKKDGADLAKLQAKINGQTCDAQGCVPYGETVSVSGKGSDRLFAKFPADLVAPAAAPPPQATPAPEEKPATFSNPDVHARPTLYVRADGGDVKAALEIVIEPGWHMYQGPEEKDVGPGHPPLGTPTRVKLVGDGFEWSPVLYPQGVRVDDDVLKSYAFEYTGTVVFYASGKAAAGADPAKLQAKVDGQTCDENGCIPYAETATNAGRGPDALFAKFPADLAVGAAPAPSSAPSTVTAGGEPDLKAMPLWQFLALAVLWGVISLLMPCTYPMIPITISFFTKQASQRNASTLPLSICYGAGIVLSYVLVGVLVGPVIQRIAANPWLNLGFGLVFVTFGLSLLGLFLLQPPQFLMGAATAATRQGGYLGVFLMGATLCITSFTCTAPFVGNLLAVGASGEKFRVVLGMTTFGLVMGVPFVVLSMVPAKVKALPKSGDWLHLLKVSLGFIEIAAAVKFISNADLVFGWQALPRELVLVLWAAILGITALYLFGVFELKEDVEIRGEQARGIGPGRLVSGLVMLLFAAYFLVGALGTRLDSITEALAPNYSRPFSVGARSPRDGDDSQRLVDSYSAALEKARAEHKYLAINFTGRT